MVAIIEFVCPANFLYRHITRAERNGNGGGGGGGVVVIKAGTGNEETGNEEMGK